MVDWSGGNDRGATPKKDAIWIAVCRDGGAALPEYFRNRQVAEAYLRDLFTDELAAGRRVVAGFDFAFGFPAGVAEKVTGSSDPLALWDWFEARIEDAPEANNRFELAGQINTLFPGTGPFWFNGVKRDIPDLPMKGTARSGHGVPEKRQAEQHAGGAFPVWQMGGAGAVGGQVFMGLPVLARLRRAFDGQVAIWPFEALDRPLSIVEVWPSLLAKAVAAQPDAHEIKDAAQVAYLAQTIAGLTPDRLATMLDVSAHPGAAEEGWIFGIGHEDELTDTTPLTPPPLRDDCFAMPRGAHWTPVDEALAHLRDNLTAVAGTESVPLAEASGRILAEPLVAKASHPPAANSAVDGYGFAGAPVGEGPQVLPLLQRRAAAGAPYDGAVPPGAAIRILTGAPLPKGVDTVVLEEDTAVGNGQVAFHGPLKPRANTRPAGEDVAEGGALFEAGRALAPQDLALLAATGHAEIPVRRRLRVGVMSTGDELRPTGEALAPGQIHDANRPMLLALLARWGMVPVDLGAQPDDRAQIRKAFDRGATEADALIASGGASAGDEDHVSALLTGTGTMNLWRVAVKPGRPLALGIWDTAPVFGLPGNPVAAFVTALIFARPALFQLAGAGWAEPQGFEVPANFSKSKKEGRREYLRARLTDGRAEVFPSEGSGRISGLSWADGLVELGDGAREIAEGDPVRFLPFGSFGL
ncbi:gephyrin-like molybdotransferase Glp [Aestuariibius sp. 2305UL40-4]|uniref:molybdopterin-binding protein n=1 Tax=Aestuariibius violaceus TaxID=3234132 RepID=UPI00345E3719